MSKCRLLVNFWCMHPALLYGFALLFGFFSSFNGGVGLITPVLGLWIPFFIVVRYNKQFWTPLLLSLTLFGAAWTFANIYYVFPNLPKSGIKGSAYLSIQSIRLQRSFFGTRWIYSCRILNFFPESSPSVSIARHINCILSLPNDTKIIRPLANRDYLVQGFLMKKEKGGFILKINPYDPWKEVDGSLNLTEARYAWKNAVLKWINNHFTSPISAVFLGGLATGEFDDQWLRNEFSRFGLQHIMAISGFHFAIIVGLLSLILRLIFSRRQSARLLLISMTGYAFFLGANPSIMRAWLMCSIVLGGYLLEKNAISLNSLGIALMGVLLIDPLFSQTIGF